LNPSPVLARLSASPRGEEETLAAGKAAEHGKSWDRELRKKEGFSAISARFLLDPRWGKW